MGLIPIAKTPYSDELMYSWIHRLAKVNMLSVTEFTEAYLGGDDERMGTLKYDVRERFLYLFHSLYQHPEEENVRDLYLSLSTFPFESFFMTEGQQARYINNIFYASDSLNTPVNLLFSKAKICPVCLEEDKNTYGEPYQHRMHHLSGVDVCPKHNVRLLEYCGKKGYACDYHIEDWKKVETTLNLSDLSAYAGYAQSLLTSGVESNATSIKELVYKELKCREYGSADDYASLRNDIEQWVHKDLIAFDINHFLRVKLLNPDYVSATELLPLLMFLFPDVSELLSKLENNPLLVDKTCPICGLNYAITPFSERIGFGCPRCEERQHRPFDERFKEYAANINPAYHPLEPFKSLDAKLLLHHDVCNHDVKIKPRAFLFEGARCLCESTVSESRAKAEIEKHEGYHLVEFHGTNDPVTIKSDKCGHTFTCRYHKFLKFPGCRICKPKHMNTEIYSERVELLTDGEYEVVGKFVDQKTPIAIRHKTCGLIKEYTPSVFLEGFRCPKCTSMNKYWNDKYELLCCYRKEYGNVDIPKRGTYKGVNLGLWVQHQREDKRNGRLLESQIKNLEALGINWEPLENDWNRKFGLYKQYVAEHGGNPYISRRTVYEGENLGAWLEIQRKALASGFMSDERLSMLKSVDPDFPAIQDTLEIEWNRMFALYCRYVEAGNLSYVTRGVMFEGEKLGQWYAIQMRQARSGKMLTERVKKLKKLNPKFPET